MGWSNKKICLLHEVILWYWYATDLMFLTELSDHRKIWFDEQEANILVTNAAYITRATCKAHGAFKTARAISWQLSSPWIWTLCLFCIFHQRSNLNWIIEWMAPFPVFKCFAFVSVKKKKRERAEQCCFITLMISFSPSTAIPKLHALATCCLEGLLWIHRFLCS